VRPDGRADTRGPGSIDTVVVQKTDSSGFDWGDAMIGSLGGVGLALLLTGAFFLLASQRNKTRVA
jgi:small neutral amino acid transporter SnatA (MarC family)